MEVSPIVFSRMQVKAAEFAVEHMIYPNVDQFAEWAHTNLACEYDTKYTIKVIWEWGTEDKWRFPVDPLATVQY